MSFLYQQKLMSDVTQRNKNGRDTEINKVNMLLTYSLYNFLEEIIWRHIPCVVHGKKCHLGGVTAFMRND